MTYQQQLAEERESERHRVLEAIEMQRNSTTARQHNGHFFIAVCDRAGRRAMADLTAAELVEHIAQCTDMLSRSKTLPAPPHDDCRPTLRTGHVADALDTEWYTSHSENALAVAYGNAEQDVSRG